MIGPAGIDEHPASTDARRRAERCKGSASSSFALILMFRSEKHTSSPPTRRRDGLARPTRGRKGSTWKRILLSWGLGLAYGAVLLGSGIHYWRSPARSVSPRHPARRHQ
jgi:hypothetical protein